MNAVNNFLLTIVLSVAVIVILFVTMVAIVKLGTKAAGKFGDWSSKRHFSTGGLSAMDYFRARMKFRRQKR